MSPRLGWVIAACLAVSCTLTAVPLLRRGPGFATLPILVPVSLEHERALRAQRGQPATVTEDPARLAQSLLGSPAASRARPGDVAALRDARLGLLDARERRHVLNVRLMDVGVAVARVLTPAQWDAVHMHRDAVRREAEAALFDRVLQRLRTPEGAAP
ncbi:MAG: hypothetical protein RLZZ299_139 [Pseudomonadota bacterium]